MHQTPSALPVLFNGACLLVYAFLPTDKELPETDVVLFGMIGEKQFAATVHVNASVISTGTQAIKLGAKSLIDDLESGRQKLDEGSLSKEVIALSTNCGVLCRRTAFIAIDERDQKIDSSMKQQLLTLLNPWEREAAAYPSSSSSSSALNGLPLTFGGKGGKGGKCVKRRAAVRGGRGGRGGGRGGSSGATKMKRSRAPQASSPIHEPQQSQRAPVNRDVVASLASLQHANGLWSLADCATLGSGTQSAASKLAGDLGITDSKGINALATLLIVAILESQFGEKKIEWKLMAAKAIKQAKKVLGEFKVNFDWDAPIQALLPSLVHSLGL